ncbi:MAG: fibronectin type III domain-containing protein [Desulfovibrionales bacterium]|nr:fibronectin type III domain-containing protein [Desulfovibrionales bacterium]
MQSFSFSTAPSGPPTDIVVTNTTNSSITIQWGPVDCVHRNGHITNYTILYGIQGNETLQTMNVSADVSEVTITELQEFTRYEIKVAAVNSAGIGEFGVKTVATLPGMNFLLHYNPTLRSATSMYM